MLLGEERIHSDLLCPHPCIAHLPVLCVLGQDAHSHSYGHFLLLVALSEDLRILPAHRLYPKTLVSKVLSYGG